MIHELLGGGATSSPLLGHGERTFSTITNDQGFLQAPFCFSPSPISASLSPSPLIPTSSASPTTSSAVTTAHHVTTATPPPATNYNVSTNFPEAQNLRCPRCDSTNTKFCYYNNYNLTQPRHFCKTCRRYWTKGGALRNVPIGGGCRKNKVAANSGGWASNGKHLSSSKAKSCLSLADFSGSHGVGFGFDSDLIPSNPPVFWPPPPEGSHILALLRSAQNPSPNTNHSPLSISFALENEGLMSINGRSHAPAPKLELGGHATKMYGEESHENQPASSNSAGLPSSLWRSNQQIQALNNQKEINGLVAGEVQSGGGTFQELLQRLKSSSKGSSFGDRQMVILSNNSTVSSSSSSSCSPNVSSTAAASVTVLGPNPVNGGDFGCLKTPLSWYDHLPTASGSAYP